MRFQSNPRDGGFTSDLVSSENSTRSAGIRSHAGGIEWAKAAVPRHRSKYGLRSLIYLAIRYLAILCLSIFCLVPGALAVSPHIDDDPLLASGMDPTEVALIRDGDFESMDDEYIQRLMFRCLRTPADLMQKSAQTNGPLPWESLLSDSQKYRFWVVEVKGRVRQVTKIRSPVNMRLDLPFYYQCLIEDDAGQRATVITLEVPSLWSGAEELNQPITCQAFFVGGFDALVGSEQRECLFISRRFQWYPTATGEVPLSAGQLELARHGFDLAALDSIYRNDRKPLSAEENGAFFSMLATTEKISAAQATASSEDISNVDNRHYDLIDLIRRPQLRTGDRVRMKGKVVQVVPVYADDGRQGDLERPSYYQVNVSVPLGQKQIAVEGPDGKKLVFRDRFPVTLVVSASIPEILETGQQRIVFDGLMYRFWNYQSAFAAEQGVTSGQFSPLIFVTAYQTVEPPEDVTAWFVPVLLVGLLGFVILLALWIGRGDRVNLSQRRQARLPPTIDVPAAGEIQEEEADTRPRFPAD